MEKFPNNPLPVPQELISRVGKWDWVGNRVRQSGQCNVQAQMQVQGWAGLKSRPQNW